MRAGRALFILLLTTIIFPCIGPAGPIADEAGAANLPLKYYIEKEVVDYYIMDDGSGQVLYELTIYVLSDSPALTRLYVPMPNYDFQPSDVSVTTGEGLMEERIKDVERAGDTSIAVNLGGKKVYGGTNRTFYIKATIDKAVFGSEKGEDLASVEYSPMWWSPDRVSEVWVLKMYMHMPRGLDNASKVDVPGAHSHRWEPREDRLIYSWEHEYPSVEQAPKMTAHFPRSAVDKVYDRFWDLEFPRLMPYIVAVIVIACVLSGVVYVLTKKREPYERPSLTVEMMGANKNLAPIELSLLKGLERSHAIKIAVAELVSRDIVEIEVEGPLSLRIIDPDRARGPPALFLRCLADGRMDEPSAREVLDRMELIARRRMRAHDLMATIEHQVGMTDEAWSKVRKGMVRDIEDGSWMMLDPEAMAKWSKVRGGYPDWTSWELGWRTAPSKKKKEAKKKNKKKKKKKMGGGGA